MATVPRNFRKEVKEETDKTIKRSPTLREAQEKGKHIDHKLSIKEGHKAGATPKELGSRQNLEPLTEKQNLKKGSNSSQTLTELRKKLK